MGEPMVDRSLYWEALSQRDHQTTLANNAARRIRELEAALQQVIAEKDEWKSTLRYCERQWQDERGAMFDKLATATSELARLRERLEIAHAYDGAGNKIPFPEGMEHLDGIECRDETIRNLEEQAARLRAEGEAKDRALTEIRDHPENYDDGRRSYAVGWAFWNIQNIARTALACAATTREG